MKTASRESREFWKPGNMLYPLPAVIVTCGKYSDKSSDYNAVTVAWTGTICSDPAMVYISVRPERYSHHFINETGEFVINLVSESMAKAADYIGVKSGRDGDKLAHEHLSVSPAQNVAAPIIDQSPVCLECKVTDQLNLGSHTMFLARVLSVDIDSSLLDTKGKLHLEKAHLMAYSHGVYYALGNELGRFGFSVKKK